LLDNQRSDKGSFRLDSRLQEFIVKAYEEGNKGSRKTTPKQVFKKAEAKAIELKITPPSQMTVYRILTPLIEKQQEKKSIRSPGWIGEVHNSL
jgi:putative transposase